MKVGVERPAPRRVSRRHGPLYSMVRYSIFESLRYQDFRWMWAGSFVSFMAMNMQMITRSWLVVRLTDDSPLFLSLSMVSFAVPVTFVSLIGGALADRVPRRRLVIISQSGNALMTLLLAILDVTGLVVFWHVMAMGVVNGSLMAFNMPSRQAIISEIVPERRLMNAISLNNSSMNLTRVVGPALAGFLILLVDTAGVFFVVSAIYLFSTLSMTMVRAGTKPAGRSGKGMTGDIREGLAYAIGDRTLRGLIIMNFIPVLFGFSYYALLPAWAREALDVQADDLGILMMLMGVGALTGTLILASMGSFRRRGGFLLISCLVWGITLAVFARMESFGPTIPLLIFIGLVSSVFMSLNMTLTQVYSAPQMRGRVMSIAMMSFGLMPLSAVPFGVLAEFTGTPFALMLSGIMLSVFTLLFAVAYPSFRRIA